MSKNGGISVVRRIDDALMVLLSFFSLMYISHDGKKFAEINVQFSFLSFPVFIGEFLLIGCGLLFLVRMVLSGQKLNKWWWGIGLFSGFIILKAIWGYSFYGPLALRQAALFYYFAFAVIGYYCFRPEYFKWWVILVYVGALHWMFFGGRFHEWWLMPRIILGLVLACRFSDRRIGILIALSVLILTPYQYFLDTSRSMILANFFSTSFLIFTFAWIFGTRNRLPFMIGSFIMIIVFGLYVFYFSGNKYAQGIISIDKLQYLYDDTDMVIQKKKDKFKSLEISGVRLFNPENTVTAEVPPSEMEFQGSTNDLSDQQVNEPPSKNAVVSVDPQQAKKTELNNMIREMKIGNSVFRLLIWRDAKRELFDKKPILGFDLGKPFRSESLEVVRWGMDDWARDGWIAMHNSYLEMIYRAGLLGVGMIVLIWSVFAYMVRIFIRFRSVVGLLLSACLIVPLTAAYFSVSFELPFAAIPTWSLFGLTLAYAHRQLQNSKITDPNGRAG